jgi:D-serine deaminase-like pyridoxal phosphate-dependent protein
MTPCLLLDEEQMSRNILRLRDRLAHSNVSFRPHLKTVKSIDVARQMLVRPEGPATVSTLAEAEYFADHGVRDLLYGVGLTHSKVSRVARLRALGTDLSVVLDNVDIAEALGKAARDSGDRIPALIEVDCGDHRGGVDPEDSSTLVAIASALTSSGARLRGVMTHAGQSYQCRSVSEITRVAEIERGAAVRAAATLKAANMSCSVISVGSTPTALFGADHGGVTELRAGVYVFFDLVMAGLGVCQTSEIALSVLSTVIGTRPRERRLIVDAGWMAMSRDRGTAQQRIDQGYGLICDTSGRPYPDFIMLESSQEHGQLGVRPGSESPLPPLSVGDQVRILPNHACATASQHEVYHVIRGQPAVVQTVWHRIRGW